MQKSLCANCKNNRGCSPDSGKGGGYRPGNNGGCSKKYSWNWLKDIPKESVNVKDAVIEVSFKNGRKGYYENQDGLDLKEGALVAVSARSGHDIGIVRLTGILAKIRAEQRHIKDTKVKEYKVYRKAGEPDIEKWQTAVDREKEALAKSRSIAHDLNLEMKISDIEFQGDNTKATFYYTADSRVDFRELIRHLADAFRIRVEMRQIGARQESSLIGGIGSCGRELCCSTWLHDFKSVSTGAARTQQLVINQLKLAGQCGKLKCCLNYELDMYREALGTFPPTSLKLNTKKGSATYVKSDVFQGIMWYNYEGAKGQLIPLHKEQVTAIIEKNKNNEIPDELIPFEKEEKTDIPGYKNVVGQDNLSRFDRPKKSRGRRKNKRFKKKGRKNNNA